jgi:hypothetical protein
MKDTHRIRPDTHLNEPCACVRAQPVAGQKPQRPGVGAKNFETTAHFRPTRTERP